jgi:hypothetical protein
MIYSQRIFLIGLFAAISVLSARAQGESRPLLICVAADAPPLIRQCAEDIQKAAASSPLLVKLGAQGVSIANSVDLVADPKTKAYAHLIMVGLPTDPLIKLAWQREARVEDQGLYIFDFGHFTGSVGYIESDRNPFLHSFQVDVNPYEAEAITITGTTPEGVAAATQAFLGKGLVNGVVAGGTWQRPKTSLLDHDPLPANFTLPAFVPASAGDATLIAVTQAGESEYRGVLQDAGVEPQEIWRFKYFLPGTWDVGGGAHSLQNYLVGLHRRAFGNTLWAARFASATEAGDAMAKIGAAAKLQLKGDKWEGHVAPTTGGMPTTTNQPRILWQHDDWLLMSTLDEVSPDSVK